MLVINQSVFHRNAGNQSISQSVFHQNAGNQLDFHPNAGKQSISFPITVQCRLYINKFSEDLKSIKQFLIKKHDIYHSFSIRIPVICQELFIRTEVIYSYHLFFKIYHLVQQQKLL